MPSLFSEKLATDLLLAEHNAAVVGRSRLTLVSNVKVDILDGATVAFNCLPILRPSGDSRVLPQSAM